MTATGKSLRLLLSVAVIAALIVVPMNFNRYGLFILSQWAVMTIAAMGLNLTLGYAGQVSLALVRARIRRLSGRPLVGDGRIVEKLRAALPYKLTPSQEFALGEINADLADPERMLRLLQGDVGSGKTVVALLAMGRAVEAGGQAALMAPTEILARQHLATIAPLAPLGSEPTRMLFIGALASFGAFCMTLLFVRWDGLRLGDIGAWPDRRSPLRLAFGFLIGLFLVGLHTGMVGSAGHVKWVRGSGIGFPDAMITLIAFLLLSFREELAFHGYPLRRFKTLFGLWGAQLIVAIAFALEHKAGGNSWKNAFLGAGVGSLLFGMAAIATRGLALPIGLHAAWNLGDWLRGGKGSSGYLKAVVENGFEERTEIVGMTSHVLVMCSATLAFWWWYRLTLRDINDHEAN